MKGPVSCESVFSAFLKLVGLKSMLIELLLVLQLVDVFFGSFFAFLGILYALYVEVMILIFAIKYVQLKGFKKFWLV